MASLRIRATEFAIRVPDFGFECRRRGFGRRGSAFEFRVRGSGPRFSGSSGGCALSKGEGPDSSHRIRGSAPRFRVRARSSRFQRAMFLFRGTEFTIRVRDSAFEPPNSRFWSKIPRSSAGARESSPRRAHLTDGSARGPVLRTDGSASGPVLRTWGVVGGADPFYVRRAWSAEQTRQSHVGRGLRSRPAGSSNGTIT